MVSDRMVSERLAIAADFAREQLDRYPGISAVFVLGSAARADGVAASDIDVKLLVPDTGGMPARPDPNQCWRGGIFIDATYAPAARYGDATALLADPYLAGSVREAVVLHDGDGAFARTQKTVAERFMQPRWLNARLSTLAKTIERNAAKAAAAFDAGDLGALCQAGGFALWTTCELLLVSQGVSPTWVRGLQKLGAVLPTERDRIIRIEGGAAMAREDVSRLAPFHQEALNPGPGALRHVQRETGWMIDNGLHREALHSLWISVALGLKARLEPGDGEDRRDEATDLARRWLRAVGWGDEALGNRVGQLTGYVGDVVRCRLKSVPP